MGRATYLLSCLLALGCTTTAAPPTVVSVPGPTEYIAVPAALSAPCVHEAAPETSGELLAAYEAARAVIVECDSRLGEIRKLSPP